MKHLHVPLVVTDGGAVRIRWAHAAAMSLVLAAVSAAIGVGLRYTLAGDFSVPTLLLCGALPVGALWGHILRERYAGH